MPPAFAKTPLHHWHAAHRARLVDFAGWSMPVQYDSIVAEHVATRTRAAMFDISHMGRFRLGGTDAAGFLDHLVTRRVARLKPGQIRYGLVTNPEGGILDDVLVYRREDHNGTPFMWMVVNAGNRAKIAAWISDHMPSRGDIQFQDQTMSTAMIAVQGPLAVALVDRFLDLSLARMKYYTGGVGRLDEEQVFVSRTGYTGEDGCELVVNARSAERVWQMLLDAGRQQEVVPAGLGARDTLRLEAAMPLYGHELSEAVNPFQAGLGFAVNLADRDFIGRDALVQLREKEGQEQRVGLQLHGRRVPRENYALYQRDRRVGAITSGTFSPTLNRPIAMAYVEPAAAEIGGQLDVDVRGRREGATVTELPFYQRA